MWTFNNIRIFTQGLTGGKSQTIARLQPISGGTVFQTFGYENEIYKVTCLVVGETDLNSIRALLETGSTYDLTGYEGSYGNFYLKSLSWSRVPVTYQTIRTDLVCTSPVFNVELELHK
jgi:hypothetical protein